MTSSWTASSSKDKWARIATLTSPKLVVTLPRRTSPALIWRRHRSCWTRWVCTETTIWAILMWGPYSTMNGQRWRLARSLQTLMSRPSSMQLANFSYKIVLLILINMTTIKMSWLILIRVLTLIRQDWLNRIKNTKRRRWKFTECSKSSNWQHSSNWLILKSNTTSSTIISTLLMTPCLRSSRCKLHSLLRRRPSVWRHCLSIK